MDLYLNTLAWIRTYKSTVRAHISLPVPQVEVHSFTVDCTVRSRFARTVMTSTAVNKGNAAREISFEVELPKTAFISNFSMSVCLYSDSILFQQFLL